MTGVHWISEGIWPFLWSNNTADWLYLMKSVNRVFLYDNSTQSFISDFLKKTSVYPQGSLICLLSLR